MGADLHIHVLPADGSVTEEHIALGNQHVLGSKHFDLFQPNSNHPDRWKYASTESVWIGSVSWLKAAFFDDSERFVPSTVQIVSDAVGEDLPVIDDELIAKIGAAWDTENTTSYSIAKREEVVSWLEAHRGLKAYTVSH